MEGTLPPAAELDPGLAATRADQAAEERFRRQREQLLLEEHGWAPGAEVTITSDIDAGMRHLVGQFDRVRRCAWRAGRLMCQVLLPPPAPVPAVHPNGRVSRPHLRAIDRIPTALWVPAEALLLPPLPICSPGC
jgi:hypothetical protein